MSGAPARRAGRRRPPVVVLAWVAVLGVTVGLGVLGQAGPTPDVAVVATPLGSTVPERGSPAAGIGQPARTTTPLPRGPLPTRPPIGEDGVMGGLVFGTAWRWLEPPEADR
jgi:hypothetical protein